MRAFIACLTAFLSLTLTVCATASTFKLTSSAFSDGGTIPQRYAYNGPGCGGQNVSPELAWSGAPSNAKSFALTVFDPDAPGKGFWHWLIFGIPAGTHELKQGEGDAKQGPAGSIHGTSDFQTPGYGGPCPPPGAPHHYVFTLYALDIARVEGASPQTSGTELVTLIDRHILAKATLTGRFGR